MPDEMVDRCATPVGRVLFVLAGLPGLDGTRARSDCAWQDDEDASRPGIFGASKLPDTTRRDWVINANDSYWLPNPDEPIEGFDRIIGCERCERSPRTRMGARGGATAGRRRTYPLRGAVSRWWASPGRSG